MIPLLAHSREVAFTFLAIGCIVTLIGTIGVVRIFWSQGCGFIVGYLLFPPIGLLLFFSNPRIILHAIVQYAGFGIIYFAVSGFDLSPSQQKMRTRRLIALLERPAANSGLEAKDRERMALKERQDRLNGWHQLLETKKAALPPGDRAAIQQFNEEAARYALELASVRPEEKRLKE